MVDPSQLKALSEKLGPEDKAALDHLMTVAVSGTTSKKMGLRDLLMKDGDFSKTSVILVACWGVGLGLWLFQSITAGFSVNGHVIPVFDSSAALAMLGAASALYMGTHNVKVNVGTSAPTAPGT